MNTVRRFVPFQLKLKLKEFIKDIFNVFSFSWVNDSSMFLSLESKKIIFLVLYLIYFLPVFNKFTSKNIFNLKERWWPISLKNLFFLDQTAAKMTAYIDKSICVPIWSEENFVVSLFFTKRRNNNNRSNS